MMYISLLLRLAAFFLSNLGYYYYIRKKTEIHVSYIPMITVGIQVSLLLLMGILNMLREGSFVLLTGGMVLLVYSLHSSDRNIFKEFISAPYVYLLLSFAFLLICLRGSRFAEYDDFSHWAVVVKTMLRDNQLPNFSSELIMFQAYPLGSSIYIYYFCRIVGSMESFQMLAQAFMMLTALMPLFYFNRKHPLCTLLYMIIFTNFVLVYLIPVTALLVDTLLPLYGMGTIAYIYAECWQKREETNQKINSRMLLTAPLLITTVMIKNSGAFFAVISACLLLAVIIKRKQSRLQGFVMAAIVGFEMFTWKKHCLYVFSDAAHSKHAMTAENYRSIISGKTEEDIISISKSVFSYMFKNKTAIYLCVIFLVLLLAVFILSRKNTTSIAVLAAVSGLIYVLYTLGMCGMYAFSMPLNEAVKLDSIDRYARTVFVAILYILSAGMLSAENTLSGSGRKTILYCTSLMCILFLWWKLEAFGVVHGNSQNNGRIWLEEQIQTADIPEGASCYISCDNPGYIYFMGRYLLWSTEITTESSSSQVLPEHLDEFDYIILENQEDEPINDWIREHYPQQAGQNTIRTGPQIE